MKLKNIEPYLIHAHLQWLDDSGAQPHIVLKNSDKVRFPDILANEPMVKFLVSQESVQNLIIDDRGISFYARFSGKEFNVYAPIDHIVYILSKDNTVNIPVQAHTPKPEVVEQEVVLSPPIVAEKVKLSSILGGGTGDGVPSGKLTLV